MGNTIAKWSLYIYIYINIWAFENVLQFVHIIKTPYEELKVCKQQFQFMEKIWMIRFTIYYCPIDESWAVPMRWSSSWTWHWSLIVVNLVFCKSWDITSIHVWNDLPITIKISNLKISIEFPNKLQGYTIIPTGYRNQANLTNLRCISHTSKEIT